MFGNSLTADQRQRRDALREAKRLTKMSGHEPEPAVIAQLAEFILTGERPSNLDR